MFMDLVRRDSVLMYNIRVFFDREIVVLRVRLFFFFILLVGMLLRL